MVGIENLVGRECEVCGWERKVHGVARPVVQAVQVYSAESSRIESRQGEDLTWCAMRIECVASAGDLESYFAWQLL